ncbi:MAG TPA: hypothetical protein VMC02_01580 [Steroidobacteraceae bacterium]|nr:hypothetical protein [Steroidobacteraceae bacterium]
MYQKPTVPRSIGGVLDDTLQLFKASIPSCWLPALLVSLVTGVLSYAVIAAMPVTATLRSTELLARYRLLIGTFGIWYLVVIVLSLVLYGMLIVNVVAVSRGETPAFGASLAKAARRAPSLFLGSLIFGIAIAIGFLLLVIPGFYVWNRLQLYMVPLVTESQGPGESLGTSWRLVGGNWWRTAAVVTVVIIILFVLELVLGVLAGIIGAIGGGGLSGSPAVLAARMSLITLIVGAVVRIFTLPLVFAAFVAIYQDLQLRKGGGDLEARLGALSKG